MKIRPVILCGGAGTRLWPNSKNHQAKQFIDFGNWTLLGKTLVPAPPHKITGLIFIKYQRKLLLLFFCLDVLAHLNKQDLLFVRISK